MAYRIPRVIGLSPGGWESAGLVVAASRAGALGVLDAGLGDEDSRLSESLPQIAQFVGDRVFGLRVAGEALARPRWSLASAPRSLGVVVLAGVGEGAWSDLVKRVQDSGRLAVAEVTSRQEARAARSAGAEALILAGHEAGELCGEESSSILLQAVLSLGLEVPVWVRGGVGPQGASAYMAVGASGVVLDGALLLARESPLPEAIRRCLVRWDGSETVVIGPETGRRVRVHAPPGSAVLDRLKAAAEQGGAVWDETLRRDVGWQADQAWPVGQDAALAPPLARRGVTVGGIVQEVERAIAESPALAARHHPFAEGGPLAVSHATRYPIVQGPMTRVSDTPAFAKAVADGGALPFLALALMRGPDVAALLHQAAARLAGRSWGVGILGFVPPELRQEQVEAIRTVKPPFALIAGGRPDQARALEDEGITTYLHVPSPGLLRQFLQEGARRFVLEGRECGGHVGPRSSFVLWEQAVEVVGEAIARGIAAEEIHLLLAGGLHDARSSAMAATLTAPLAARGVKLGLLVGTAYLFTEEAVASGAIVPGFQTEALRCARTVLLTTGPGHEVRVSPTPFAEAFARERRRLIAEGRSAGEIREALEALNAGRLRVAAKGLDRSDGGGSLLVRVAPEDQYQRGTYMLGQVATLRDRITTIAALHRELCDGGLAWLERRPIVHAEPKRREPPSDIAIVGLDAIFPQAPDVDTFWRNTLNGVDAIIEVPPDRWDWRLYFDPDPKTPDAITSKWGGFLPDVPFDPLRYGMPPSALPAIEPVQLLALEVVRRALEDAGYGERPFPRERTAVVLGAGGGAAQMAMGYAFRSYLPLLDTAAPGAGRELLQRCRHLLPEWTEDSFPGILLNVIAGRIANRFDLGGANYTVDAACGSSLAAAYLAVRELETGSADMVILAGADTVQNPFTYLAFSKTHAFSPRGRCRPFDAGADGIVISEGIAALVLKRLADAERDGDRILAVIKGLGASSDGRAKGLTAPRVEGQIAALRRAYEKAGIAPETLGYIEAHGTGTAAGDVAEVAALRQVFGLDGTARPNSCALGSVKSLIGHTKCAAGLAGLINVALALYHKVLPPTIGVSVPNPRAPLDGSPFYLSTQTRPWLHVEADHPRRAGVSAFGFGGTNFHAVLEAYEGDPLESRRASPLRDWPSELFVWRAPQRRALQQDLERWRAVLNRAERPPLRELAHAASEAAEATGTDGSPTATVAIVAHSHDDLREKLGIAIHVVGSDRSEAHDPRGIHFTERTRSARGRVAFLFPGQGAQYPDMLRELAVAFAEVREAFETFDRVLRAEGRSPVGPRVFPPPAFDDAAREQQRLALRSPEVAQPALGAASVGLMRLLESLGIVPDVLAGHSYGELVALHAAGSLTVEALAVLSEARGRLLMAAEGDEPGAMAALAAGPDQVETLLHGLDDVAPVNWNGPRQTVIAGTRQAIDRAMERARAQAIRGQALPVARAFHSPLVAGAREPLVEQVEALAPRPPGKPVYSNLTAAPYPNEAATIARQLGDHLASPVRFAEMIEAMHADGVRVFIEVGPGATLAGLVDAILEGRPHVALACDPPSRPGLSALLRTLARLVVSGVPVRLERLTAGRARGTIDPRRLEDTLASEALPPSAWLVNGTRARPALGPEPPRLGQAAAAAPPAALGDDGRTPRPLARTVREPGRTPTPAEPRDLPRSNALRPPSANGWHPPLSALAESPHAADASRSTAADPVLAAFQKTMRAFLDVQRETMLGYLATGDEPPASTHDHIQNSKFSNSELSPTDLRPLDPAQNAAGNGPAAPTDRSAPAEAGSSGPDARQDAIDRDGLEQRLLAIVQERTGYPTEMLRLDLDLEADLGIDSIKRVEILGSLREAVASRNGPVESATMDALAKARTLGAIVDQLAADLDRSSPKARNHPEIEPRSNQGPSEPAIDSAVRRLVLDLVEAPLAPESSSLAPGGLVLVTDDERGIARAVAADLRSQGFRVLRIRDGQDDGTSGDDRHEAEHLVRVDLTSEASVGRLMERIRARGRVSALVHALPLWRRPGPGLDATAWAARMGPEVRGLFLLARAAADDLARAAEQGGACLIAATALGGDFASASAGAASAPEFFAGQGAVAGLVKTLAREWPGVRARVVDFPAEDELEVVAAELVREVLANDDEPEVGYLDGRRVALRAVEASLDRQRAPQIELAPGEPILVTGGARGITATVALDLARRWRPTLLLVGAGPPPEDHEPAETAGLTTPTDLKAAVMARLRREHRDASPAEVETAYRALMRQREMRANLQALRDAGATVEYAKADVRDGEALRQLLSDWRRRFGHPVGLIHGAGVIQDKWLRDKTLASFDHVVSTKLDGALTLARGLDPQSLKFAVFFSSVAGRFGNRGQADYAAANEALSKLALWLDRRWPGRVVSMIWGPWSGIGMVSGLQEHLDRQGLGTIQPEVGCSKLADELRFGRKGQVEVIVAGELGPLIHPQSARRHPMIELLNL